MLLPRILYLHPSTYQRLIRLSKEAERDGVYRVAQRSQAVVLNSQGRASGESAEILRAPRSKVSEWVARYQAHGVEGSLESHRSGRPAQLTAMQRPLSTVAFVAVHDRTGRIVGISPTPRHWFASSPGFLLKCDPTQS